MATYTDEQIAAMDNVTPEIAGKYIGKSAEFVRIGLILGKFPFGVAFKKTQYVYHIPGPALVRYKQFGRERDG